MLVTNHMRKIGIISTTATIAAISLVYALYAYRHRRSRSRCNNKSNLHYQNHVINSAYDRSESQDVWENANDTLTKEIIHTPEQLYKHGLEHLNVAIDYWNRALNYIDTIIPSIQSQPDLLLQTNNEINTNLLLTSVDTTNHSELKQKLQFLLSKVAIPSNITDSLFTTIDTRASSPLFSSPTTFVSSFTRQESIRQQQQTALNVQNDLNTFNDRRSLCSLRSRDSFESCADDAEWLETSDILFDPLSSYYSMPSYYAYGLRLAEKNQVPYRKLRTKLLTCSSDTDYLAKLFCIRNACDEVLSGDEKRDYIKLVSRAICEKFLEKSSKDATRFLQAFEQMNVLMADPSNTSMIMEEMSSAGIKSPTIYNVGIDFMLLEGFEILDSPPSAMKTILQNRWFSENFREQYNNGFLTTFLSLIEDMSPVFAWGILGPPSKVKPIREISFEDAVLDFARSLYDLNRTDYSSLQSLIQSIDKQLQDLLTRIVLEMNVDQSLLIQPIQNKAVPV
ncbi:unnamed protein product [Didymodactylos carnosus]|uniref:Uncharacterized protein n=1 Tax=Didymodactylos carnosus TaxID=1234261 RepID=A0A8S2HDA2_9BILA|nr:unnamed protein product [Didymodactylos carnosus]CAF3632258.1 unnamed protein product [Didymodactylos carnosus]